MPMTISTDEWRRMTSQLYNFNTLTQKLKQTSDEMSLVLTSQATELAVLRHMVQSLETRVQDLESRLG